VEHTVGLEFPEAKALGTTAQFWLNGQLALDLYQASHDEEELRQLERIEPVSL
jgi:plasmid maintenance system antidote protein VapI